MSRPSSDELLRRAKLALSQSRSAREESSALRARAAQERHVRDLLRSAKSVETELENTLLTSRESERKLVGDALGEARSVRISFEELLESLKS